MHIEELTISRHIPLAIIPPLDAAERRNLPPEILTLDRLQRVLHISDKQLAMLLGSMGSLKKNPPRREATTIAQPQFSAWKIGHEGIPRWRLAQATVICEFFGCYREKEAKDILRSDADDTRKRVAWMKLKTLEHVAAFDLAQLQQREDLQEYLPLLRKALYRRLEADAHLSAMDKALFDVWRGCSQTNAPPSVTKEGKRKKARR